MSKWGAGLGGRWRRAVRWYLTVSLVAWRDANPTTLNEQATNKQKNKLGAANSRNDAERGCGAEAV